MNLDEDWDPDKHDQQMASLYDKRPGTADDGDEDEGDSEGEIEIEVGMLVLISLMIND